MGKMVSGLKDLPLLVQILALIIIFLLLGGWIIFKHREKMAEIVRKEKEEQEKTKRVEALTKCYIEENGKTNIVKNVVASSNKLEQKTKKLFEHYEDEVVKSLNEDSSDTFNREKTPVHKPSKSKWIKSLLKGKGVIKN